MIGRDYTPSYDLFSDEAQAMFARAHSAFSVERLAKRILRRHEEACRSCRVGAACPEQGVLARAHLDAAAAVTAGAFR